MLPADRARPDALALRKAVLLLAFPAALAALASGPLSAQGFDFEPPREEFDPEAEKERLLDLITKQVFEKESSPSVLEGIDLSRAPASTRQVARVLRETRLDLILEKEGVAETLKLLSTVSGLNFVLSAKAREALAEERRELSITLRNLPLESILNLLAVHLGDYRFTVRYGAVMLVRKEEHRPQRTTVVYPIHDLVRRPPDFPAPKLGLEDLNPR
jgi:hypothetical protein